MGDFDHIFFDNNGKLQNIWKISNNPGIPSPPLTNQPPIIQAIFDKKPFEEILHLIKTRNEVNSCGTNQISPLHAAAIVNCPKIALSLIEHGAQVNARDSNKRTPLHQACLVNSADVVEELLKHKPNLPATDKYNQNAIQIAVTRGSYDCISRLACMAPALDENRRNNIHLSTIFGFDKPIPLLAKYRCKVNALDSTSFSPLHYAALFNQPECAEALLQLKANVNIANQKGFTPLYVAASVNSITRLLLQKGAKTGVRTQTGNTPLHIACLRGHLDVIRDLLEFRADLTAKNGKGQSALHMAAISSNDDALQLLIDMKQSDIDLNAQCEMGLTPLHMTIINGKFTRCKLLLDFGADVNIADKNGYTPLHFAAKYGHDVLVTALVQAGAELDKGGFQSRTALHVGCLAGCVESCRKLIQLGADINAADEKGRTPTHLAAFKGTIGCLDLLVSNGAKFTVKDNFGRTPLHYAVQQGHFQCVFTLVGIGSDVNERDYQKCTSLHMAAGYELKGECVEYLLSHKADVFAQDKNGFTTIHYGLASGNFKGVIALIEAVGNTNRLQEEGMPLTTPLHLAAKMGKIDLLRMILTYFKSVNIQNEDGYTPLMVTAMHGHFDCMDLLIKFGADIEICDNRNNTALHYTAKYGHDSCLQLLLKHKNSKQYINLINNDSETALYYSVLYKNLKCCNLLLKAGADPNICDKEQCSPLMISLDQTDSKIFDLLLANKANATAKEKHGKTPLILTILFDKLMWVLSLEPHLKDEDYKTPDNNNYTPLHWAAYCKNDRFADYLLSKNVTCTEGNIFSPVHCAAAKGRMGIIEEFVKHFDVSVLHLRDKLQRTPLHICSLSGHSDTGRYLIETGSDTDAKDVNEVTPLMLAARMKRVSYCVTFTTRENNSLEQDILGNTALHWACIRNSSGCALIILENVKDKEQCAKLINIKNKIGRRAIHYAAANGMCKIVQMMIRKGATVTDENVDLIQRALKIAILPTARSCLQIILRHIHRKLNNIEMNQKEALKERIFGFL